MGHTPGEWKYNGYDVVTGAIVAEKRTWGYGCDNDFICDLNDGEYHEYSSKEEQDANGRLIAAAPNLLEACVEAEDWLDNHGGDPNTDPGLSDLLKMLQQAIAKAGGE